MSYTSFTDRSTFTVAWTTPEVIAIIDMDRGMSVTNDACNVVDFLLAKYGNRRIFYRDTTNRWDELVHNGHGFTCFRPISDFDKKKFNLP
jgi:hypothetical protein